jgi:hypothetical protein
MSQLPQKHTTFIPYLPGPATHTTGAGRVLDGVRDQTQGSASLAFGCTGPGLVPVLSAGCHQFAGVGGSVQSSGRLLYFPSCYQKTACHYTTRNNNCLKTAGEQQGNGMGTAWERHGMCESALREPAHSPTRTKQPDYIFSICCRDIVNELERTA